MYAIPFLDIPPLRSAAGRVRLPGSKSISNRVLLLAGLAAGTTAITLPGDPERHAREKRTRDGIVLDEGTWGQLSDLAGRLGVAVPPGLA